jgi:hypothetical protein
MAQCAGGAITAPPTMPLSRIDPARAGALLLGATLVAAAMAGIAAPGVIAPETPVRTSSPPAPSAAAGAAPDLQALVKQARQAQRADILAWREYRFDRQERIEELTDTGQVKSVRTFDFEITPVGEGFDERLLMRDGLTPSEGEIEDQRRSGRFQKHYQTLLAGSEEEDPEGGYSISTLLRLSEYRYGGREMLEGVECHRLDFEPQEHPPGSGLEARIAEAMSGSLWLSAEGAHLVRARTTSSRPITLSLGLFKVQSLEVGFDAERVAADRFLPRQLSIVSHARLVFLGQHRRRVFTYSEYTPLPPRPGSAPGPGSERGVPLPGPG